MFDFWLWKHSLFVLQKTNIQEVVSLWQKIFWLVYLY